jgi:hypothetical protein
MSCIDPGAFRYSPFLVTPKPGEGGAQRGGLGNLSGIASATTEAHQLFGAQLPQLLDELNSTLGTGTGDMIARCLKAGLPEPLFTLTDGFVVTLRRKPDQAFVAVGGQVAPPVTPPVTGEVTGEVATLLQVCRGTMSRRELRQALLLKGDDNFRQLYLVPALKTGLIEMTIPDKPNSRLQKYRLTDKGRAWLAAATKDEKK